MRLPSTRISPSLGGSRPAIILSSVVLPQPDGPTTTKSSPSPMLRSMGRSEATSPSRVRYVFAAPTISIIGRPAGAGATSTARAMATAATSQRHVCRQIVVRVEVFRVVLRGGVKPAILDHDRNRVAHVLLTDLERLPRGAGGIGIERNGQLEPLRQGLDASAFRIGLEYGLRRRLGILDGSDDRLRARQH